MIERERRLGFAGPRGVLGIFGSALAVALLAIGLLAPAGQAASRPFISFSPVLFSFGQIPPGSSTTKTFTLTNSGGTATAPLSDVLIASSSFKITSDQCTGVSLAAGKSCTVTVTYAPTAANAHDLGSLWAYGPKPAVAAVAAFAGSSSAKPVADLSITKTDGATVVAGMPTTYKIVVSNAGPSNVTGATVTDTMPASLSGVSYTTAVTGGASDSHATGTGNISDTVSLPVSSTITYTVTGTVASSATGSLSNTATVTPPAGVTDPNPNNNSATATNPITRTADLSISKTDTATSVTPGMATTYTIVVSNAGPSDVTGATVADTMPSAITTDSYTAVAGGAPGASGFTTPGTGNINDTVNLPSGSSITYTVIANVGSSATPTLNLSNTATVTPPSTVTDPNPSNNSSTDTEPIGGSESCTTNCTVTSGNDSTGAVTVTASGSTGSTGTVQAAVFTGTLTCTGYLPHDLQLDPNTYEVTSTSGLFSKTVGIEFPAGSGAPAIDSGDGPVTPTGDGDNDYDDVLANSEICFQATYTFATRPGTPAASFNATTGLYTGLLPNCPDPASGATGPCHERADDFVSGVGGDGTTDYDVNLTAFIPPNAGDPRMN